MRKLIFSLAFYLTSACLPSKITDFPIPLNSPPSTIIEPKVEQLPWAPVKKTKHLTTYLDQDLFKFSDEIIAAINAWNHALNGYIVISTNLISVKNIEGQSLTAVTENENNLTILLYDDPDKKYIDKYALAVVGEKTIHIIERYLKRDMVFKLIIHELGHCFGAQHNRNSLTMHPGYGDGYNTIDYYTMKSVADWQKIPIQDLNCATSPCTFR